MTVAIVAGMALDDFMEQLEREPFELINGERRVRLPNVFGHSEILRLFFRYLDALVVANQLGEACSETTFVLPDTDENDWVTGSRIPDIMFYAGTRVAEYKSAHANHRRRPLAPVPDFVAEIVSPNDKYSELDEKIDAYLADGVRLIWVVDPQRRKAVVYAPDMEQPLHLTDDATLDAGDVIPGFQIQLKELFA